MESIFFIVSAFISFTCVSFLLLICLKIKSSKKDPAFIGTEGRICSLTTDENGDVNHDKTVLKHTPSSPFDAHRQITSTPLRPNGTSNDRKLPEIPKNHLGIAKVTDNSDSDDEEDDDEEIDERDTGGVRSTLRDTPGAAGSSKEHPYAKVKKKIEHPYATVKKTISGDSSKRSVDEAVRPSSSDEADEESSSLMRHRLQSRSGSGRSNNLLHHEASSSQSVASRQTTPLPPEPSSLLAQVTSAATHNPNVIHFSGDSQDSSKGYTSISVREPVSHIQLHRPPQIPQDATYATVSETSDDMYAAIEDPTYVPTGGQGSQSNSDTYAVIDLPEETGAAASRGGVSMMPQPTSTKPYNPYSKIEKSKKRGGPQFPEPGQTQALYSSSNVNSMPFSYNIEDMYAKVNKRSSAGMELDEDPDLDMPVGASAMHSSFELGARPRIGRRNELKIASNPSRSTKRSEINYSDFEVNRYDREQNLSEGGYETVPNEEQLLGNSGYAELGQQSGLTKKYSWTKPRLNSTNSGYETVPNKDDIDGARDDKDPNYEQVPDYWLSSNSGGGYETVPECFAVDGDTRNSTRVTSSGKDHGYEIVRNNKVYSSFAQSEEGYESVKERSNQAGFREPPYAELVRTSAKEEEINDAEVGYETIPRMIDDDEGDEDLPYSVVSRSQNIPMSERSSCQKTVKSHELLTASSSLSGYDKSDIRDDRMQISGVDDTETEAAEVDTHIFV